MNMLLRLFVILVNTIIAISAVLVFLFVLKAVCVLSSRLLCTEGSKTYRVLRSLVNSLNSILQMYHTITLGLVYVCGFCFGILVILAAIA